MVRYLEGLRALIDKAPKAKPKRILEMKDLSDLDDVGQHLRQDSTTGARRAHSLGLFQRGHHEGREGPGFSGVVAEQKNSNLWRKYLRDRRVFSWDKKIAGSVKSSEFDFVLYCSGV